MSSSGDTDVPSSTELVDDQSSYSQLTAWIGAYGGAIGGAFAFLVIAPLTAAAEGGGNILGQFTAGMAQLLGSLGTGAGSIIDSGAAGTSSYVAGQGLGFVIAIGIVILTGVAWTTILDATNSDLPFWQRIPVLGWFFSDNDDQ